MTIAHYGAAKLILLGVYGVAAAAIVVINPTVEVALIVAVPGIITGMGTICLALLNRRDARKDASEMKAIQSKMQTSIDGHFTKLLDQKQIISEQLVEKTDKLSHAEGRREGIESTEEKPK